MVNDEFTGLLIWNKRYENGCAVNNNIVHSGPVPNVQEVFAHLI